MIPQLVGIGPLTGHRNTVFLSAASGPRQEGTS